MSTVSWVILTHNRQDIVARSLDHNIENAGAQWDEVIHVDNGSTDFVINVVYMRLDPNVTIRNKRNLGVAKGYNRGMGLATKDYIVITGCDMLMPNNWLRTFKDYVEKIPQTGVACMYSKPLDTCRERARKTLDGDWNIDVVNSLPLSPAMPVERRIFPRRLLADIGYFPEDFGLYGWDDIAWAHRAEAVCNRLGLLYYVIPGMLAEHLGTEGINSSDGKDHPAYHEMKQKEVMDPHKMEVLARRKAAGWPKFSPFL